MFSKLRSIFCKVFLFTLLFSIVGITTIFGVETWQKTFGGNNVDYGRCVLTINDGFLAVGSTSSYGAGGFDIYVLKIDIHGNRLWHKTFGGKADDFAFCVVKARGGYLIAGWTKSFGAGKSDVYILKIDEDGNKLWEKTYGGPGDDYAYQTLVIDNGFVIVGSTRSFEGKASQAYVIKIDEEGEIVWEKNYGMESDEGLFSIEKTADGYLAVGQSNKSGNFDAYFLWLSESGEMIKEEYRGGPYEDFIYRIKRTVDGGYVAVGASESPQYNRNFYVVRLNNEGKLSWERIYHGPKPDVARCVLEMADGYLVFGSTNSYGAGYDDFYLLKIDSKGEKLWSKTYGGKGFDVGYCIATIPVGGFIMIGDTTSTGSGGFDIYILKIDELGGLSN
ncbi:MAG TPA: hypothetical protein VIL29_10850 [Pseudothermotoga sp.]